MCGACMHTALCIAMVTTLRVFGFAAWRIGMLAALHQLV